MNECFGNYFILNGELQPVELFDNSLVYDGDSIYEVIRMVKGLPFFFNDHVGRLETSVRLQKRTMLAEIKELRRDIIALSGSEKKKEINLKIVFNYNNDLQNYVIYFIEPIYPSAEQYKKGVNGILFFAERKDPESKVINHKLRTEIYQKLIFEGAYEALLVNSDNCVTEGSRTNIFFIKGETLITAPEKAVLSGITRKHILEICSEGGINVEFSCVKADKISEYESVIMTGTSPVVLPFYCIDNKFFNVKHPLIALLRNLYLVKAEESMHGFTMK
jgi:branched-chain amino acid aminotransferase